MELAHSSFTAWHAAAPWLAVGEGVAPLLAGALRRREPARRARRLSLIPTLDAELQCRRRLAPRQGSAPRTLAELQRAWRRCRTCDQGPDRGPDLRARLALLRACGAARLRAWTRAELPLDMLDGAVRALAACLDPSGSAHPRRVSLDAAHAAHAGTQAAADNVKPRTQHPGEGAAGCLESSGCAVTVERPAGAARAPAAGAGASAARADFEPLHPGTAPDGAAAAAERRELPAVRAEGGRAEAAHRPAGGADAAFAADILQALAGTPLPVPWQRGP